MIRERMVAHLLNIDETLGKRSATPSPGDDAETAMRRCHPPRTSTLAGPQHHPAWAEAFRGRKLGILATGRRGRRAPRRP